jgi:putative membrane protein
MWGSNFTEWGSSFCSWGPSFGHGPWFMGWVFPLLFWGFIAYIIISIIKRLFSGNQVDQGDSALTTLRNRYAFGEINEQEYKAEKSILASK